MLKSGDKVSINGNTYTLNNELGKGAEGAIFDLVELPKAAVKIINSNKLDAVKRKEIVERLMWLKQLRNSKSPIKKFITLPQMILDDQLGYAMTYLIGCHDLNSMMDLPRNVDPAEYLKTEYNIKTRYSICAFLFDSLRELHINGLIFTDLSPNNIMTTNIGKSLTFIDCDNIRKSTDSFLGVVGTEGYMAPEIYRKPNFEDAKKFGLNPDAFKGNIKVSANSDIFSAAIIAFKLLTLSHPFIGDRLEEDMDEREKGLRIETEFVIGSKNNKCTSNLCPFYEQLTTPKIRDLFKRTFVNGKNHPNLRPTDAEFVEAFREAQDMIITCPKCGISQIYNPGKENICFGCDSKYDKQPVLSIVQCFPGCDIKEIINHCGDFEQYNLDLDDTANLIQENVISKILIERTFSKDHLLSKGIRLRHLEAVGQYEDRDKLIAQISYTQNDNTVNIIVPKSGTLEAEILDRETGKYYKDLGSGQRFRPDKHCVRFVKTPHGEIGEMNILGIINEE